MAFGFEKIGVFDVGGLGEPAVPAAPEGVPSAEWKLTQAILAAWAGRAKRRRSTTRRTDFFITTR